MHRRRLFLPLPGLAVLAMGRRIYLYRYRLGQTPRPLGAWRIPGVKKTQPDRPKTATPVL